MVSLILLNKINAALLRILLKRTRDLLYEDIFILEFQQLAQSLVQSLVSGKAFFKAHFVFVCLLPFVCYVLFNVPYLSSLFIFCHLPLCFPVFPHSFN